MLFNPSHSNAVCILLGLVATSFTGCSGSHELETAPVRGTVTLDGRPLEAGGVMFIPPRGRAATGVIGADGTYSIGTYEPGDGAVVGPHSVTITPYFANAASEDDSPSQPPSQHFMVPRPYSGISVKVEPGKDNVIDIPLSSAQ